MHVQTVQAVQTVLIYNAYSTYNTYKGILQELGFVFKDLQSLPQIVFSS